MRADAVFFAAVGDLRFDNNPTLKVRPETGLLAMRKKLGLFANVRPVATFDCLLHKSPLKDELLRGADFVVLRELTGGMYFGEKYQDNDKAYDTDIYTRPEIERILKVGFEMAMKRRRHLTVVDKANVLASSRLWRQIAKEMEPLYPDVKTDYMFIDNASMRVLTEPRFFDVIVTENTFGDILTDETSCITGSMGLQPSSSLGEHTPLFEPVHGSWPQAAGQNLANPLAQILSGAMLLEHFGLEKEGALVREAVNASLDANVRRMRKLLVMSLMLMAVCAQAQTPQQWRDSVKTLMEQIRLHPQNIDLRLKKAEANINLQQWDYAISEYGDVLRLDEKNLAALYFRAYCYTQQHHYDLAKVDYETFIMIDPLQLSAHLGLAHILQKLGRKADTIDQFNRCVQLFPDSASAYAARAAYETEQKLYDVALYDWDEAIRLQPKNVEYAVSKIDALLRQRRILDARLALDELVRKGTPRAALKEWYDRCR